MKASKIDYKLVNTFAGRGSASRGDAAICMAMFNIEYAYEQLISERIYTSIDLEILARIDNYYGKL